MKFETLDALTVHSIGGGWGLEIEDEGHTECVAVIRGTDIPKLALGDTSSVPVRWETSSKVRTRLLQYGDIVMEVSGGSAATGQHTGRALFVTLEILEKLGGRVIPASFCRLLRLDSEKIDPKYISYQIANMHLTEEIALFENQSTGISNFQFTRFLGSIYPLTNDLQTQSSIANFFDSIDRQIITLQQINSSLESIAKAIFQSWFVDFDPVRVKLDGGKPIGLDEATANLFPNTFQESELGHIPKGWEIRSVGDVVDCVGGGTPSTAEPKYWEGGTHHWTTPKDFSSLKSPILLRTDRKLTDAGIAKISSGLLPIGTVLLSSRAPVGYLAIASMPVAINQGFIALKCNEYASNYFMLNWCQSNMLEIESRATGTTFAEISKQNFRPIRVVLPPKRLVSAFTTKVEPLYEQITANLRQSQTLASLRDTLLPKLLSGELSVENLQP